jgi:hypothetical protein
MLPIRINDMASEFSTDLFREQDLATHLCLMTLIQAL